MAQEALSESEDEHGHYSSSHLNDKTRQDYLETELPRLVSELGRVGVTRYLLWQEYKQKNPKGYSYSLFCQRIKDYKYRVNTTMRLEHKAAYRLTIDFAGKKMSWVDKNSGEVHYCEVLVCTLPYSGYTYACALGSQKQEDFIQGINKCLRYLGGSPKVLLSDNLKSYVSKPDRYEPSFTKLCQQLSAHYQIELEATRVAKPKDKAHVERHVAIVYNQVYGPLRDKIFHSIEQLNKSMEGQLEILNAKNYQGKQDSRCQLFKDHEQPYLHSLPTEMFIPQRNTKAKVQRNCHILLGEDKHQYSVPYQYVGKSTEVIYTTEDVEVYCGEHRIAIHKRDRRKYGYTSNPSHMPEKNRKYNEQLAWDAAYFENWAAQIGDNTVWAISYILESKSLIEQTYRSCLGVLSLAKKHTPQRLEVACHRARAAGRVNYGILKNILEKNLDKIPTRQSRIDFTTPQHNNIRGAKKYS